MSRPHTTNAISAHLQTPLAGEAVIVRVTPARDASRLRVAEHRVAVVGENEAVRDRSIRGFVS